MREGDRPFDTALADELDAARLVLEGLAAGLCLDPAVALGHMDALQGFDELAQRMGEIARLMRRPGGGEGQDAAMAAVRLETLRLRLAERLAA